MTEEAVHHLNSTSNISIITKITEVFGFTFVYLVLLKAIITRDP